MAAKSVSNKCKNNETNTYAAAEDFFYVFSNVSIAVNI